MSESAGTGIDDASVCKRRSAIAAIFARRVLGSSGEPVRIAYKFVLTAKWKKK